MDQKSNDTTNEFYSYESRVACTSILHVTVLHDGLTLVGDVTGGTQIPTTSASPRVVRS